MILLLLALAASQVSGVSRTALVTVADSRSQPIVDLGPDDFVVDESGQIRDVLSLRMADYPVALLIDNSDGARADFEEIRKAAARFVARLGQRPIVIGTLGDPPTMITSFDDDRARLLEQLRGIAAKPASPSMLLQGVANAARVIHATGAPFSAIVVISATPADETRNPPGDLFAAIHASEAVVHAVANRAASSTGAPATPGARETLRELTEQSRGQFTTIYSAASYPAALDRLVDRMARELMIEYLVPAGPLAGDVKIGVRLLGARVTGLGVKPR